MDVLFCVLLGVVMLTMAIVKMAEIAKKKKAENKVFEASEFKRTLNNKLSFEILPCRWAHMASSDMPWELSLVYDYRDPTRNNTYNTKIIAYVEAVAPMGTLQLKFSDDSRMRPEVREHYVNMFIERFPDWADPRPERIAEKDDSWRADPEELARKEAADAAALAAYQAKLAAKPKCPNCKSTNIRPISIGKRVVSTELLGMASPTIGKSYECLACKYKW